MRSRPRWRGGDRAGLAEPIDEIRGLDERRRLRLSEVNDLKARRNGGLQGDRRAQAEGRRRRGPDCRYAQGRPAHF